MCNKRQGGGRWITELGKATEGEADITHYLITITLSDSGIDEWKRMRAISLQAANGNGKLDENEEEEDKKQCVNNNQKLLFPPESDLPTRWFNKTEENVTIFSFGNTFQWAQLHPNSRPVQFEAQTKQ